MSASVTSGGNISSSSSLAGGGSGVLAGGSQVSQEGGRTNTNNSSNATDQQSIVLPGTTSPMISQALGAMKLSVRHAFGCQPTKIDALQSFQSASGNKDYSDRLVHKIGKQLCIYDPETGNKEFFNNRVKNIVEIVHFTISANNRFISMCELVRNEKHSGGNNATAATVASTQAGDTGASVAGGVNGGPSVANSTITGGQTATTADGNTAVTTTSSSGLTPQITVYSLASLNRLKTVHHTVSRPFICSSFLGDHKLLAALTDEPERMIVVWHWEKEKFYKAITIPPTLGVSLMRGAPCNTMMLTTSGPFALKCWTLAPDGTLRNSNLLPSAKESLDTYSDHLWLPSNLGLHRMVALADPDPNNELNRFRKQCLYIFEGQETSGGSGGKAGAPSLSSNASLPINMELKQTIHLKLDNGCRIEKIIPAVKSFSVVGMYGIIITYERTDDKHEPYVEARRMSLGDLHLTGGTVYPSEERMVVLTKTGRMLSMGMDITPEQLKKYAQRLAASEASSQHGHEDGGSAHGGSLAGDDDSLASGHRGHSAHGSHSGSHHLDTHSSTSSQFDSSSLNQICDVTHGGYHTSAVLAADIAMERPIIITISADNSARVWNYMTGKCEMVHYFRQEEPVTVACHPAGFQIIVSFKDRVRCYNVLMDKIKPCRETVLKNSRALKYSNGGQYWAAASAISVLVYETRTFQQLMNFQGHMMTVTRLSWAIGDQVLFSAGMDGNVYGWPIAKDGRIDVITASNRSSQILDIAVDSPSTVFPVSSRDDEEGGHKQTNVDLGYNTNSRSWLVVTSLDGHTRMPNWFLEQAKSNNHSSGSVALSNNNQSMLNYYNKIYPTTDLSPILYGEASVYITCIQVSQDRTKLFAGTSIGSIRVYPWPPEPQSCSQTPPAIGTSIASTHGNGHHSHNLYNHHHISYEIFMHSAPVVAIRLGVVENTIVTAGADGSVFVHTFTEDRNLIPKQPKPAAAASGSGTGTTASSIMLYNESSFADDEENMVLNDEVVLLATEDIEEHVNQIVELQKILHETRTKNDFASRKIEAEHNEAMKRISEQHELTINREKDMFEKQRNKFDIRIRELLGTLESKENEHIKILTELENKYEHKLADQLERYDLLSEKMSLLKQKCESLLEAEKTNFNKQMNDFKNDASTKEKKLRAENRRAIEDKAANENAFREIINQQEEEYEDELRQLIKAAESELVSERETILKLRTLVQTKNTKLDQLKKKLIDIDSTSKARLQLLTIERDEKQKLLDTIEHYKKNLIEREDALAEKERVVLELRSKTRTLENFRFVLDHRLQQLSSERGPITTHIEGLEKHIATMYEELVEEFSAKKTAIDSAVLKDQKIVWISQDLTKMRQYLREKEQYIAGFKRELGNIVSSMAVGKELEESVKMLYKKFVKGETGGATKSIAKMNVKVADAVNEMIHGKPKNGLLGHHHGPGHHELDEQSFLSSETPGIHGHGNGSPGRIGTGIGGHGGALNGTNLNGNGGQVSRSFMNEIEDALIDTAKEADRQKKFVERQAFNLKHRLRSTEREANLTARHRLHENSDLLFECNDLRTENKELNRTIDILKHDLDMTQRHVNELKNQMIELKKSGSLPGGGSIYGSPGKSRRTTSSPDRDDNKSRSVNPMPADWIVHNTLHGTTAPLSGGGGGMPRSASTGVLDGTTPTPTAGGGAATGGVEDGEDESIHSIHGVAALLKKKQDKKDLSKSMPNLHNEGGGDSGGEGGGGKRTGSPNKGKRSGPGSVLKGQSGLKSLSQTQPMIKIGAVEGGTAIPPSAATVTIPRPDFVKDGQTVPLLSSSVKVNKNKPTSSMAGVGITAGAAVLQFQVEKLTSECENLAGQLDDAIREREMQRIELSRLRKQLMNLSQNPAVLTNPLIGTGSAPGSVHGGMTGLNGGGSLQLPSIVSNDSLPSVHLQGKNVPTHADLYGYPSEEDKKEMRIGLAQGSGASAKSRASSSGGNGANKSNPATGRKTPITDRVSAFYILL